LVRHCLLKQKGENVTTKLDRLWQLSWHVDCEPPARASRLPWKPPQHPACLATGKPPTRRNGERPVAQPDGRGQPVPVCLRAVSRFHRVKVEK